MKMMSPQVKLDWWQSLIANCGAQKLCSEGKVHYEIVHDVICYTRVVKESSAVSRTNATFILKIRSKEASF